MEHPLKIYKRDQKTVKKIPRSYLKEVKTKGDPESVAAAVKSLQETGCTYFEVVDQGNQKKTTYTMGIFCKNYKVKTYKIQG